MENYTDNESRKISVVLSEECHKGRADKGQAEGIEEAHVVRIVHVEARHAQEDASDHRLVAGEKI